MMDGRGGCCITRYVGAGGYDLSNVDRIMLRFRPIAPKPVPGNNPSGWHKGVGVERTKRKHGRDGSNMSIHDKNIARSNKRCSRRRTAPTEARGDPVPLVTLPLLPEAPDGKEYSFPAHLTVRKERNVPMWLCFENYDAVKPEPAVLSVGSCLTVECVTDTCLDGNSLGCTDSERLSHLSSDVCPCFLSSGLSTVTWANHSLVNLLSHHVTTNGMELCLLMNENVSSTIMYLISSYPCFTCRVKLDSYSGGKGKEKSSLTVPCDVWRMDSGGFAWRLDVKTALTLSLDTT